MKSILRNLQGTTWVVVSLVLAIFSMSTMAADKTAHQVAEDVKAKMVEIINDRAKYDAEGEGKYQAAVVALFDPVVDFEFIARGVMATHAKTASDDQRKRFAEVLKTSLMSTVTTYTQGLSGTNNFDIKVIPPKDGDEKKDQVSVGLEVTTGDAVNRLAFRMQHKNDEWKIANMTLNGINLGVTFRAQFDQAVKKANGDIDAAINGWSS